MCWAWEVILDTFKHFVTYPHGQLHLRAEILITVLVFSGAGVLIYFCCRGIERNLAVEEVAKKGDKVPKGADKVLAP